MVIKVSARSPERVITHESGQFKALESAARSRDLREENLNKTMNDFVKPQFKPILNEKRHDSRITSHNDRKNEFAT